MPRPGLVARDAKINKMRTYPCLQLSMELGECRAQEQLWLGEIHYQGKDKARCLGYPRSISSSSPDEETPVQGTRPDSE